MYVTEHARNKEKSVSKLEEKVIKLIWIKFPRKVLKQIRVSEKLSKLS